MRLSGHGDKKTEDWKTGGKDVDLATAVATSGAAIAPHMALLSVDPVTALLAFLNLRLGYWLRRPSVCPAYRFAARPGFTLLLKKMFGIRMSKKEDWLLLTDGAHLENSGAFELLRRRCKFIVAVDASTDAEGTFGTLMTLVRHALIDFGVQIAPNLRDLRPDRSTGLAPAHSALCRIKYPAAGNLQAGDGFLLFLKSSVSGNESELIRAYRAAHPEFPNQSTLDQFFDEEQFEVYRQLGVHVADGMLAPALLRRGGDPISVSDWFRCLARNMLHRD